MFAKEHFFAKKKVTAVETLLGKWKPKNKLQVYIDYTVHTHTHYFSKLNIF